MEVRINKNIAVSTNGFVFNPLTGDSFSTNAVGQEIIKQLQKGSTREELTHHISKIFDVEEALAEKDLKDFFIMLQNYQIIQEKK